MAVLLFRVLEVDDLLAAVSRFAKRALGTAKTVERLAESGEHALLVAGVVAFQLGRDEGDGVLGLGLEAGDLRELVFDLLLNGLDGGEDVGERHSAGTFRCGGGEREMLSLVERRVPSADAAVRDDELWVAHGGAVPDEGTVVLRRPAQDGLLEGLAG
jgi:hypothetical protein